MKNRILIVEDEVAIAKMISMNLKVSNYDTKIYTDGLEAAEALKEDSEYDLALLDVMLPGVDGFELLNNTAFRLFFSRQRMILNLKYRD